MDCAGQRSATTLSPTPTSPKAVSRSAGQRSPKSAPRRRTRPPVDFSDIGTSFLRRAIGFTVCPIHFSRKEISRIGHFVRCTRQEVGLGRRTVVFHPRKTGRFRFLKVSGGS